MITVTKIKQERTNQDMTKIGSFFNFLLHFLIFLLGIFSVAPQLSCEAMFKISTTNIKKCTEKIEEMTNFGPILIGPFLLNLCHGSSSRSFVSSNVTVKTEL